MKGSRDSGLDAALPLRQPVKRADGLVVGQDDGDLPPTGRVGGLALCAGLWLGHGSDAASGGHVGAKAGLHPEGATAAAGDDPRGFGGFGCREQRVGVTGNVGGVLAGKGGQGAAGELVDVCWRGRFAAARAADVVGAGEDGIELFGADVHGFLRVGPIPTVGPLSPVTSDLSSPLPTVRREVWPDQEAA